MKKISLTILVTFFYLVTDCIHPIKEIQPPTPLIDFLQNLSELEKRASKPIYYIRHGKNSNWFVGGVYNFYDKRIFFGRDKSRKPIYKKISEHAADNPDFGNILLVIYYHKKKDHKQFVILGTYSNEVARKKFVRKMHTLLGYAYARATWCPHQKVFILSQIDLINDGWGNSIDRAFDYTIGQKFEEWYKNYKRNA